ncbi:hypothetical protein J7K43_04815 [Candidatus Calescamantes bacterium]|nr:hypothetical protein [Candidatus Calescamantes bacterium]
MEGFFVYPLKRNSGKRETPYDLFFTNPKVSKREVSFFLDSFSIKGIKYGIVKVLGWHREIFTPSLLRKLMELDIQRLPLAEGVKHPQGKGKVKKILVLSRVTSSSEGKRNLEKFLEGKGIDHIITFEILFWGLLDKIKENQNYTSPLLEILRILKSYRMLKTPQLEFFDHHK